MNTELGLFLRRVRLALGLTLQEVAAQAHLPWTTVRAVEVGRSLRPRPETLQAIATVLGVDYDVLALKAYGRHTHAPAVPPTEEATSIR